MVILLTCSSLPLDFWLSLFGFVVVPSWGVVVKRLFVCLCGEVLGELILEMAAEKTAWVGFASASGVLGVNGLLGG